jgi:hypothetical protein
MSTTLPQLQPLTTAIAQAESGGGIAGVAATANNPGNLFIGDQGYGTASNGETIFGSMSDGWAALENQVQGMLNGSSSIYNPNMSIQDAASLYTGGDNPTAWANNVATGLGTTPSSSLASANSSAGGDQSPSAVQSIINRVIAAANPFSTSPTGQGGPSLTSRLQLSRIIVIIIGLLLIAAALFSFKTTQTVIQGSAKLLKTAGEIAA